MTGATREQLRGADISPLAAFELLHRMMGRLGVDTSDATSDVDAFAEAQWRCRLCTNWRQCRRWLDREVADESYRHFCSNATLLERMHARFQTVPTPEA